MLARISPAWVTALVALSILTAYEALHPAGFFFDDSVQDLLPAYTLNYDALKQGTICQINFYQYLGYTPLADPQGGAFYFPIYVALGLAEWLGNPPVAIEWLCWVHLAAASLVVERFLRLWNIDPFKSVPLAIFYMVQPSIFCAPQLCVCVSYVVFYVPLVFLCLEWLVRDFSFRRVWWLALVKTLFFLSGHANFFALSLLYEAAYVVVRPCFFPKAGMRSVGGGIGAWLAANILCVGWACIALGPVLAHLAQSAERAAGLSLAEAFRCRLNLADFLMVQIDNAHSSNLSVPLFLYPDSWFYLGGSLLFIPVMIYLSGNREMRFFFLLFLSALLLCTVLFLSVHWLPLYASFRFPSKSFVFAVFFYSAALGLLLSRERPWWLGKVGLPALFLGIFGNILTSFHYEDSSVGPGRIYRRYQTVFHLPLEQLAKGRSVLVTFDQADRDPDFLEYLYATAARVPVVQGYDPLVSNQNYQEALQTNYEASLSLKHKRLDDAMIEHLRGWSVRYYFFQKGLPGLADVESSPLFRQVWQTGRVLIYEYLHPVPMAYFEDQPEKAVAYEFDANTVRLSTQGRTGNLSISLVPLPGYAWRVEGGSWHDVPAKPSGRMSFTVDRSAGQIELRYGEPHLGFFALVSATTFLLSLILFGLSRSGPKETA